MESVFSLEAMQAARDNFTVNKADFEHFLRCWSKQDCGHCIKTPQCAWCPFSWACVPNTHEPAFLAPAYHDDICPARAERWELRSQPFGCSASSYTVFTTAIAVNVTLLTVLFLWLFAIALRHVRRRSRAAARPRYVVGWWSAAPPLEPPRDGETQPLLVGR